MNITTTRKALEEAIYAAQRVAPTTAPLPALTGVLLSARGEKLTITGTNLNTTIINTIIPEEIIDEGEVVLPAKHLYELVRRLPDGSINVVQEEDCVKVFYGKQQVTIKFYAANEFPVVPQKKGAEIEINTEVLLNALQKVTFACTTDEIHGILTGVHFSATPFGVEFAASDKHRISYVSVSDIMVGENEFRVTVPKSTIDQLKLFPDKTIKATIGENMIAFQGENLLIVSRLLVGKFFDYNSLPRSFSSECTIKTREFTETLNRAALLNEKVCLEGKKDLLIVTTEGEKGSLCESIEMEHTGELIDIAFNVKHLIDALNVSGTSTKLKFLDKRACQVEYGNYYCFIMAREKKAASSTKTASSADKKSA